MDLAEAAAAHALLPVELDLPGLHVPHGPRQHAAEVTQTLVSPRSSKISKLTYRFTDRVASHDSHTDSV